MDCLADICDNILVQLASFSTSILTLLFAYTFPWVNNWTKPATQLYNVLMIFLSHTKCITVTWTVKREFNKAHTYHVRQSHKGRWNCSWTTLHVRFGWKPLIDRNGLLLFGCLANIPRGSWPTFSLWKGSEKWSLISTKTVVFVVTNRLFGFFKC